MKKKFFSVAMCLCVMVFVSLVFVGCNDNPPAQSTPVHDSKAWFTESELSSVGLSGLKAPTGCTGEIYTDENNAWGEMVFNQSCESVDIMTQNAQTILNYFTQNYGGKFGYAELYASTIDNDKFYYNINLSTELNDYFDDNPSPMYTFYYILNEDVDTDGYYVEGAVYSLEIRFESGKIKLFIDDAGENDYGNIKMYYKLVG